MQLTNLSAMATIGVVKEFPINEEYKKPTGISPQDIARLREWVRTQPHLPADYITDLDLILTYHCCGRSSEVSKQVLDTHLTARTLFTSFFKNRVVDSKILSQCQKFLVTLLPTRTKEGYAVLYTQIIDKDSRNFVLADAIRFMLMVIDLWQYEEGTWPGFVMISNLGDMTLGHLTKLDLPSLQQLTYYLQDALLANLKASHIINAPAFYDTLIGIAKPFMKNSLLDIIHVHQVGSRTLEEFYPIEALPIEAGGSYKSVHECKDEMTMKLKANAKYFLEENKKRVVEARRPGKPKVISDIFGGIEGSFKKLDID